MSPDKRLLFLKVYFLVGAVAGLIGTLVGFGGLANQLFQKRIISDEEYIASQMYYEIQVCEQPRYDIRPDAAPGELQRTPEEIQVCKDAVTLRLSQQRSYTIKSQIISGGVWGTLFFIVFLTHLPWLRRQYKGEEATA